MVNKEQRDNLLTLLEQEEVQVKILQILWTRCFGQNTAPTGDGELKKQISSLESRISEKENNVAALKREVASAQATREQADKKLQEQLQINHDMEQRLNRYRDYFEDDLRIQNAYVDFSDSTKSSLSGIFKDTSIKGLIACGIQEGNISNLWDYVKNEVVHGNNPDESHLVALFEMLFSRFALAYPMYQLEASLEGKEFDNQEHIKHQSSSASSGTIKKVLLPGYRNTKTGKVVKQSVVVL